METGLREDCVSIHHSSFGKSGYGKHWCETRSFVHSLDVTIANFALVLLRVRTEKGVRNRPLRTQHQHTRASADLHEVSKPTLALVGDVRLACGDLCH